MISRWLQELTSETFLSAVGSLRRAGAASVSMAWLVGVARHKLVDHWRRREREQRSLRLTSGSEPEVADPWDAELDALRARHVLGILGPHHRAVLTLRHVDGLGVAEVAEHLGRTVGATEALLVRARAAFRAQYEHQEGRP